MDVGSGKGSSRLSRAQYKAAQRIAKSTATSEGLAFYRDDGSLCISKDIGDRKEVLVVMSGGKPVKGALEMRFSDGS